MPRTLGNITNRSYGNDFFNYTRIHFGNDNDIKKTKVVKLICRIYLEIVRIMPQLVLLFLVYFGAKSQALGNEYAGRIGGGHSVHILGHG